MKAFLDVYLLPACFQKFEAGDLIFVCQFSELLLLIQGSRQVIYWLRSLQLLS